MNHDEPGNHCIIRHLQLKLKNKNELIDVIKNSFQTIKGAKKSMSKAWFE